MLLLILIAGRYSKVFAQPPGTADSADKVTIRIISTVKLVGIQKDTGSLTKLIGNVQLQQDADMMYCDSAFINQAQNNMEAFGNVRIVQPGGTEVQSDYLRYTGNKKLAYLKGNVKLTDGANTLWSEELTYDVGTKIGVYDNGGTLQSGTTTVSSNSGMYNVKTKDARFTGEVFITDPEYNVTSDDLGYNTETKLVRFFAKSVVTNDKSELRTSSGTYDSKNEIAHFVTRSSIQNREQYIEADKIDYSHISGIGLARGQVIAIDTAQHVTLWSGYASYSEKSRRLFAYIKPVLMKRSGDDSLFIRADTFFSAPDVRKVAVLKKGKKTAVADSGIKATITDSVVQKAPVNDSAAVVIKINSAKNPAVSTEALKQSAREKRRSKKHLPQADSTTISAAQNLNTANNTDTTAPRYYLGYRHVMIFSDSLQGRCDSICYLIRDSVMKMMRDPVVWSRTSQITGDTILLFTGDSNKVKRLFVPGNGLIVSGSGPPKAELYDQVQGKTITGLFKDNTIREMIVLPNAETIYYSKDDNGAYLGVVNAQGERLRAYFADQGLTRIRFEQDTKTTMTPMEKADFKSLRLSRFKWLDAVRPRSRAELFK